MAPARPETLEVDVLIVGSGPAGATYARTLVESDPSLRVLMVDLGGQLSAQAGRNQKNIYLYNYSEDGLDALSSLVHAELTPTSVPLAAPWPETLNPISQPPTPPPRYRMNGANPDQADWDNLPAAASSFNVGGMGAHWTCCTPRPTPVERADFIPPQEWDAYLAGAEALLKTTQKAFESSKRGQVVREALAEVFDASLPRDRGVQMLPLACERLTPRWVEWTGVDTILGPLAVPGVIPPERFQIWQEVICRRLVHDGSTVTAAELEHLPTGARTSVRAKAFVVAANAFCTPQLLWASGIRPAALGHYLNDQPMLFCQVVLKRSLVQRIGERAGAGTGDPYPIPEDDPIPNVWIPFSDPEHPYHCQVHRDAFPYSILPQDLGVDHRLIIELRWFTRKEIRYEDCVTFSDDNLDMYGMPQPTFHYSLTAKDAEVVNAAFQDMTKAAAALGGYLPGREPAVLPRGSSLHFQGTFRMGTSPQESVCNPDSQVWGFGNLFLGGNGIIPTSTACNPTLTTVALALRTCASQAMAKCLGATPAKPARRALQPASA